MYDFEPKLSWSSSKGDKLTKDFYRPALENAVLYQRKAGYFSSTAFAGIVNEIIDMIKRNGRIQLVTSPNLSTYDKSILKESVENREKMLSEIFLDDLIKDPDGIKQHFAKLMAYMLTNMIDGKPQLEIKIALTLDGQGIFHEKTGLIKLTDGREIGFQGSVNETSSAWNNINTENFVVFCNWRDDTNKQGIKDIKNDFEDIWNGKATHVRIFDLPTAVKNHLLKISPKSTIEFQDTFKKIHELINPEKKEEGKEVKPDLRQYQKDAIDNWMENGSRGIFSMATGTGKTYNTFGCISKISKKYQKLVTIIACPQTHLLEQWKKVLVEFNTIMPDDVKVNVDRQIICYAETRWRPKLEEILYEFNKKTFSGENLISNFIIFVTHATLNSKDFKEYIDEITNSKILLIVDEVHNIGSELSLNALLDRYDYRLGLSATPLRHYDKEGSDALLKYFEKIVYSYPLWKAIKDKVLCGYEYYPRFAELTIDEMDVYHDLTRKIAARMQNKNLKKNDDDSGNDPANLRANLISNAEKKLEKLREILIEKNWSLKQTLIYCTSHPSPNLPKESPTQLDNVNELISNHHFTVKSVTYRDPTKDRGEILNNLAIGHYDCITAVKCLDEGTDIPSVETAIIMASSGNPKQYIQRRGRVLRQSKDTGKINAVIYDILVKPPRSDNESIQEREKKLLEKELFRYNEFASIAINKVKAMEAVKDVADYYGITLAKFDPESINDLS